MLRETIKSYMISSEITNKGESSSQRKQGSSGHTYFKLELNSSILEYTLPGLNLLIAGL